MQGKKKSGEKWTALLSDTEVNQVRGQLLDSYEWNTVLNKLQEAPVREAARSNQRKAAAQAAVSPKPTYTPKPANWRKKTFTADFGGSTQAHEMFTSLSPGGGGDTAPGRGETPKTSYGSRRPMSNKGRQFQLEKQRQMQELRHLSNLRAQYKEDLAVANYNHTQYVMQYMRTPATDLRTTSIDRVRAKEKAKQARERAERDKIGRKSIDSRHVIAQNEAEARAKAKADAEASGSSETGPKAEARAKAEAIAAKRAAASMSRSEPPPAPPPANLTVISGQSWPTRSSDEAAVPELTSAYLPPSYHMPRTTASAPTAPLAVPVSVYASVKEAREQGGDAATQLRDRPRLRERGPSPEPPIFRPDLVLQRRESGIGKELIERELANSELIQTLQRQALEDLDDDADSVWSALDTNREAPTGAGAVPVHHRRLRSAFDAFDADGSGHICKVELSAILKEFRIEKTDAEIDELLREADLDNNGVLDFDEFVAIFSKTRLSTGLGAAFAEQGLLSLLRGW